jgi:propanol-preferring alcohol dehydrogenase
MQATSRALFVERPGQPLQTAFREPPTPGPKELLLRVRACGVCRTDLHVVDGELPHPKACVIPGHEVVGEVVALGPGASRFSIGTRVGVPWLGQTCGECRYCKSGCENLCASALFTGYTRDGGYADYTLAHEDYCLALPDAYSDAEAAPLLCAGLIGYRSFKMTGDARRIGIYGFGAAAHIIAQIAHFQGREIYAFTRPGDVAAQQFARDLGAVWAGDSTSPPPEPLDAAILFAPVGSLIPAALAATTPGGIVVCGGIHMSDIPSFPYRLLWEERIVRSVANLTRADGEEFFQLAPQHPLRLHSQPYPLDKANQALADLREGRLQGAAVLFP